MFPLSCLSVIGPEGGGNGRRAELMRRRAASRIGRGKRRRLHKGIERHQRYVPPPLSIGYRPRGRRERAAGSIYAPARSVQNRAW
jgi:hypothetical protein